MKKSIVAMLSITALATVANADPFEGITGTHFNTTTVGDPFYGFLDDGGSNTGPFYWFAATDVVYYCESQFGTYTNTADLGSYTGDRPAITNTYDGIYDRCLSIDTEGGRLYRRMAGDLQEPAGTIDGFTQFDVTSSLYFDSLVQFTVNEDEAPTIQTGDKLAVWLKGGETTNLVVTAGYLDPNNETPLVVSNYVTTASVEPGTWHRLTIEACNLVTSNGDPVIGENQESGYLGFRVRIDGQLLTTSGSVGDVATFVSAIVGTGDVTADALAYAGNFELFPSLTYSANQCTALSCVAFEGTGAVDDLTFTDTDPFGVTPSGNPVVDGTTLDPAQVFFTNGVAAARTDRAITYPTAPVLSGDVGSQKITFGGVEVEVPEYYTATLNGNVVSLALNNTALPTIGAANVTVGEETEAKEAIEVDATTFTATLTGTNSKLYYGLSVATTPNPANWPAPASLTQGDGTPKQITAAKPVDGENNVLPAGFFKVYVTDIPPASAGE